ncbi:MAG: TolC family protein, partial [Verrucomicrobia bacterium]|nr:TolC family protein [Verrucomicrobiota bacterium]
SAQARLAAALAVPVTALRDLRLAPPPPATTLTPDALVAARRQSLQSRAEVLLALAHYESAQAALALEVAKQRPDFHLGPGYQWDQGANKWSLALSFELPLFHRNEAVIAEAVAHRTEAAAQFHAAQAQVIASLDSAVAAQSAAATQLESARRLSDEFSRQAARAQQRVKLGATDETERLLAELDLAAARLALTDASAAAAVAAGQLEDALQVPFPALAALTP